MTRIDQCHRPRIYLGTTTKEVTTTSTNYGTTSFAHTVTKTLTSNFGLLDGDTQEFAKVKKINAFHNLAYFSIEDKDEASSFGITESGLLQWNGNNAWIA